MENHLADVLGLTQETKRTPLPFNGELIHDIHCGLNYIAVEKMNIEVGRVYTKDHAHWDNAFEYLMNKTGY